MSELHRGGAWGDLGLFLLAGASLLLAMLGAIGAFVQGGLPIGPGRAAAYGGLGLFGFLYCVVRLARRQPEYVPNPELPNRGFISAEDFHEDSLETSVGRLRLAVTFVACAIAMLTALTWLASAWAWPAKLWLFFPGSAFVAWAALATAWQAWDMRRRPSLRMDRRGIDHAHFGSTDWSNVVGIRVTMIGENPILQMGFSDPRAVRATGLARFLPRRSFWRISMSALDVSSDRIQAAARSLRSRVEPPPVDGWFPGISPAQLELMRAQERLLAGLERLQSQPVTETSIAEAEALMRDLDRGTAKPPPDTAG